MGRKTIYVFMACDNEATLTLYENEEIKKSEYNGPTEIRRALDTLSARLDAETGKSKREDKLALFKDHASKSPEERDSTIQTGLYNSYIAGYLAFTLEGMGKDHTEIQRTLEALKAELDTHTAQEARERGTA